MRKILALVCLMFVLAAPVCAQTGPPAPLCGIGHMDYTTGEFVCDDPPQGAPGGESGDPNGIGHMDAPAQSGDITTAATMLLAEVFMTVTSL